MTLTELTAVQYALGQLRMAYDLHRGGHLQAHEYERRARRALAELASEPYDILREEGPRHGESPEAVSVKGGAA